MNELELQENFLIFQTSFLKLLEPKQIPASSTMQGINQNVDEIVFLMNGSMSVGYNHDQFMLRNGVRSIREVSQNFVERQQKSFQSRPSQFGRVSRMDSEETIKKVLSQSVRKNMQHRFPLKLLPGQIIGIYEILFIQKSMFSYKSSSGHLDAFFMRRQNFRRLLNETHELGNLLENFVKYILLDYIQQIYLPVQQYQDKIIEIEHQKTLLKLNTNLFKKENGHGRASIFDPFFQKLSAGFKKLRSGVSSESMLADEDKLLKMFRDRPKRRTIFNEVQT